MKADELRRNNLVSYKGEIIKIEQITKRKIGYFKEPNKTRMYYARLVDIYPIPITEQILDRCGFIHYATSYARDRDRTEIWETVKGWFLIINNYERESSVNLLIKHLHQLQNAYYLASNTEIDIKI